VNEPTHVDLFSGIGGFALAAQWAGFRTVAFCEIDKYCQKILAKNFGVVSDAEHDGSCRTEANAPKSGSNGTQDGILERSDAPRLSSNIFDFDGTLYRGCDLLTGGFPCQPFSVAGKRRGAADDRALWPQMFRVIKEARPTWILCENVPGIIPMELDNVLSDLEGIGYATRSFVIPACAVDAKHRRDRVWIIAHADAAGLGERWGSEPIPTQLDTVERVGEAAARTDQRRDKTASLGSETVADAKGNSEWAGLREAGEGRQRGRRPNDCCRWLPEPDMGRVAHGIPNRVDRLKGLGNAIVPQVAFEILKVIYDQTCHRSPTKSSEKSES
jgi:DNA (cytosine-5)-methyltransferase 1